MKHIKKVFKLCLSALVISIIYSCTSKEDQLRHLLSDLSVNQNFNGYLTVLQDGKLLLDKALTLEENNLTPINRESKVHLASLTKAFTEISTLRLVEEGKLELDKFIIDYRPDFKPEFGKEVTVRHLLNMSSGLPRELSSNGFIGVDFDENGFAGPGLDSIPNLALSFEPGTKEAYSNIGYWILGSIIEAATNTSLESAYDNYIFSPLQMTNSGIDAGDISTSHVYNNGEWKTDPNQYAMRYASGGAYSSVSDLEKLGQALLSGDYLKDSAIEQLFGSDGKMEVFGSLPSASNMFILDRNKQTLLICLNNIGLRDLNKMIELKGGIEAILGEQSNGSGKPRQRVTLNPKSQLSDSIRLERGMKKWIAAIEAADANEIFEVINEYSIPGSNERNDKTWSEIVNLHSRFTNFRFAGYRWVEDQKPGGIEAWFVTDEGAKIALLWIPNDKNPDEVAFLMVKPDDMEWMGEKF